MSDAWNDPYSSLGGNLTHTLLNTLGRSIVIGDYDDRPFPTEAELSKRHGVSRSVTREAVKMLTAKGLVTARPRRGTKVEPMSVWNLFDPDVLRWLLDRRFSIDLLRQFTELCTAIEPAAAALAASVGSRDGLRRIRAGYDRMAAAEAGDDDPLEADIAFHLAILHASANPFFARFGDVVTSVLQISIRIAGRIAGRTADLSAHHAALVAIESRKPQAAHRAMTAIAEEAMTVIATRGA